METKYYITIGADGAGPFTKDEFLGHPQLLPDSRVWYTGMEAWIPLSDTPVYAEYLAARARHEPPPVIAAGPPAVEPHDAPPPVTPVDAPAEEPQPLRRSRWKRAAPYISFVAVAMVGAGAYAFYLSSRATAEKAKTDTARERIENRELKEENSAVRERAAKSEKKASDADAARKRQISENYTQYFVADVTYEVKGFGGIRSLKCSFGNRCEYTVENATVRVRILQANGGVYGEHFFHFADVPPNSSVRLDGPDFDRGVEVRESIESLTCKGAEFELSNTGD